MAKKNQKLTYKVFIGDKQVDKLPPEHLDKMVERLGEVMSDYYSNHLNEYKIL